MAQTFSGNLYRATACRYWRQQFRVIHVLSSRWRLDWTTMRNEQSTLEESTSLYLLDTLMEGARGGKAAGVVEGSWHQDSFIVQTYTCR